MIQKIEQLPGWDGHIDRLAAEQLLANQRIGSYLLRNGDDVTDAVISQLEASNHIKLKPYLCTLLESNDKISDILFLKSARGWTIYRDNPDLSDSEYVYFASVTKLLGHIHARARFPLS